MTKQADIATREDRGLEDRREDVRTWLQMVKAVLPLEREANRLFARQFGQSLPRFDVLAQLDLEGDGGLPVGTFAGRLELVDAMPMTPTRKIIKGELARKLREDAAV